ncbi:hypothetical protein OQI89_08165 [Lentilactobacillus diolivorans]|uniref:LiaF transmembrane domain-containing protein n=1 Tax=Lentilactobacillus diolivorans TaxID=179838 RepID=UPI00246834A3|nr:hypothetical protein [Lentilactobacillus diolivorans]MDH5105822.1 hypothetical protein [Lentilactobacillus diolivorans]
MWRAGKRRFVVGFIFLLGAISILAAKMGWFSYHLSASTIIWTILLVIVLVSCVADLNIFGSVFSLAFLSMLYAGPLGITHLVPWTILLIALLISIGLSIILQPLTHKHYWHQFTKRYRGNWVSYNFTGGDKDEANEDESDGKIIDGDQSHPIVNMKMGSSVRYIHSDDFKQADIYASIGDLKVYFDDAKIQGEAATINLDANMADVELYVPKNWRIVNQIDPFMADVDVTNRSEGIAGPTVTLNGRAKMADVDVYFV